jgi:hypothetical protein
VAGSLTGATLGAAAEGTGPDTGKILYTPDPDRNGQDVLSYTVTDGHGGTATATLTVDITPVNDAPVAGPDAISAQTGLGLFTVLAADGVLSNDSDIDGDPLTVTLDDSLAVTISPDGSISYLPTLPTTETVRYTVSDGTLSSTGILTITVTLGPPVDTELFLLAPSDTSSRGTASTTRPSPATPVLDIDGDGHPGLTIRSSSMNPTESDHTKFQEWDFPVASDMVLNGPVTLDLWTSLEGKAGEDLDYAAWLDDCLGATCTPLTSTSNIHVDDWSSSTSWELRQVTVGSLANRLVPAGHTIRVRLAFNHKDVWLPLGGGMDTSLHLTQ